MNTTNLTDEDLHHCVEALFERYYARAEQAANDIAIGGVSLSAKAHGGIGRGLIVTYTVALDGTTAAGSIDPTSSNGFRAPFEEALHRIGYQKKHEEVRRIGVMPISMSAE